MNIPFGSGDYERGFKDGQEARRREDVQRDYERGFRDGYGTPEPIRIPPWPIYPMNPNRHWGSPTIGEIRYTLTCTPPMTYTIN